MQLQSTSDPTIPTMNYSAVIASNGNTSDNYATGTFPMHTTPDLHIDDSLFLAYQIDSAHAPVLTKILKLHHNTGSETTSGAIQGLIHAMISKFNEYANKERELAEYDRSMSATISELNLSIASEENERNQIQLQYDELSMKHEHLESKYKRLEELFTEFQNDTNRLHDVQSQNESLEESIRRMRSEMTQANRAAEERIADLKKELNECKQQYENAVEEAKLKTQTAANTVSELRNELEKKLSEQNEKSETTIHSLESKIKQMKSIEEANQARNKTTLENLKKERDELKSSAENQTQRILKLKAKLTKISDTNTKLNEEIAQLKSNIVIMEQTQRDMEIKHNDTAKTLHELQNSLTEAKRKAEIYDKMSALINSRM